jgi:D-alanyl-D-alanine carboxypeptidase (penicillin-binding protein 5/6)
MIVFLCTMLALACAVVGVWSGLQLTPPGGTQADLRANVQVTRGETMATLATSLQRLGLIRDARSFELYASLRRLDGHLVPGIYYLSAAMGVTGLVGHLVQGQPDAQMVTIPAGLRATQYPSYLAPLLPHFDSASFVRIAQTGTLPDGTALTSRYWYVPPRGVNVAYALEGYLAPGVYQILTAVDAAQVANLLVARFGEQLCPGPDAAHLDAYLANAAACLAHAASLGSGAHATSLVAALQVRFGANDPRTALYDGLTLASLVARAAPRPQDAGGIAAVYDNRYLAAIQNGSDPAGDNVQQLDAPATAQYARDTDHPPASSAWWAPLSADPARVDPSSPYNSAAPGHAGLIPGPIASSTWQDLTAVASASSPSYYFATACDTAFYASSAAEAMGVQVKVRFVTAAGCPANQLTYPTTDIAANATGADLPTSRLLPPRTQTPPPGIGAAYAYLMNPQTGQVLLAQGADGEHPMASTTKLMTALVAVTYGRLDQPITVGQDINSLAGTGASVAGLAPGETLTLRELLYALLLPSGDDAGIVMADGIAGSQAGFVWLMNDEARLLGLTHTHYANPHGLDEDGHYTSAADLVWLATIDLQHVALADVVGTESLTLPATVGHPQFYWVNTNELLWPPAYPGVIGVKTGYTGGAGYCLVFAAKGPSGMLVGVVLDDSSYLGRFTDARALLDWGFAAEARVR